MLDQMSMLSPRGDIMNKKEEFIKGLVWGAVFFGIVAVIMLVVFFVFM